MLETILTNFADHVKEKITEFTTELTQNYDFQQFEDVVADLIDDLATSIVHVCLQEVLDDKEVLSELRRIGTGQGLKFHGYRTISVYVYTGRRVRIRSPYFVRRDKKRGRKKSGPNGRGRHLGLDLLGFVARGSSKFVSWVTKLALLVPSFAIAKDVLSDHGIHLAVNTLRRCCRQLGMLGLVARGKVSFDGHEDLKGMTLVLEVDGGRLRLRRRKRGKKKQHHTRQGYHTNWKEPKLFTIYLQDKQGRIVKTFSPVHDATLGGDDEVFALIAQYLDQLDLSVLSRVVVCGDGARWIWLRVESLFHDRGVTPENVYEVVDYTHAKQNLQEIIDLAPSKSRKRLMKRWKNLLFNGDIEGLGTAIRHVLRGQKLEEGLKKWKDYFVRNAKRMQYRALRDAHLPCGSGHVESAIRRVINLRLKAPGTFWTKDMGEYFLFLRSQLLSGRWKIFMNNIRTRLAKEGEHFIDVHTKNGQPIAGVVT